jgi:hypothetical protein
MSLSARLAPDRIPFKCGLPRPAAHAPQQHEQRKRYSTAVTRHLDSSSINVNLFYQVSQTESAKELTSFRRFCGVETINTLPTLGILEKK